MKNRRSTLINETYIIFVEDCCFGKPIIEILNSCTQAENQNTAQNPYQE